MNEASFCRNEWVFCELFCGNFKECRDEYEIKRRSRYVPMHVEPLNAHATKNNSNRTKSRQTTDLIKQKYVQQHGLKIPTQGTRYKLIHQEICLLHGHIMLVWSSAHQSCENILVLIKNMHSLQRKHCQIKTWEF